MLFTAPIEQVSGLTIFVAVNTVRLRQLCLKLWLPFVNTHLRKCRLRRGRKKECLVVLVVARDWRHRHVCVLAEAPIGAAGRDDRLT